MPNSLQSGHLESPPSTVYAIGELTSALGLLWLTSQMDYLKGFVSGPRSVGAAELAQLTDPDGSSRYYVAVRGAKSIDTGVREFTVQTESGRETGRAVTRSYYALQVGDRYLVVQSSREATPQWAEGELVTRPGDFDDHFFADPGLSGKRNLFYPMMLSTASYRAPGYWAIGILIAVLGLLYWKALPLWRWLQDPGSHPLVRRVASWGDPIGSSANVERELATPQVVRAGTWTLTDRFLVRVAFFSFDILRLDDLLWAYQRTTKHSVHFIPTGKTHAVHLQFHGGAATVPGSEARVKAILESIVQRAPWAIVGYSDQLAKTFRTNTADFCAAVERRRAELSGAH